MFAPQGGLLRLCVPACACMCAWFDCFVPLIACVCGAGSTVFGEDLYGIVIVRELEGCFGLSDMIRVKCGYPTGEVP